MCILILTSSFLTADVASISEIKNNIDLAVKKQNEAHMIAEYVRGFGESEDHPAILFAQEKWREQEYILNELKQQYNKALELEKLKDKYIGVFRISYYCPCLKCNGGYNNTATGNPLRPWHTIAVDPSIIKLNSTVYIDGYGTFKAEDTGGSIKGNRIDICVNNHTEAYQLGVVYKDVYIK